MSRPTRSYRLYRIWGHIKSRCLNPNVPAWPDYGGRGISICAAWVNDFTAFEAWALANGYSDELSIDRVDNNGNYTPENCRWATMKENSRNRRSNRLLTAFNETKSIQEWSEDPRCTITVGALRRRIVKGWADEDAITKPQRYRRASDTTLHRKHKSEGVGLAYSEGRRTNYFAELHDLEWLRSRDTLSASAIATDLGCSRSAVNKARARLREAC